MRWNLDEHVKVVQSHAGQAWTAAAQAGAEIDTLGYDEALVIVNAGTVGTDATINVKVQHCATSGGTFADITNAAFTEIDADSDDTVYCGRLQLAGAKPSSVYRYIKVIATVATATSDLGVVVLLSRQDRLPITPTTTVAFSL